MLEHPDHALALHVVRHPVTQEGNTISPIWTIGVLSVQRIGEDEARFDQSHFVYDRDTDPAIPLADLRALTTPSSHVIGCIERVANSTGLAHRRSVSPHEIAIPCVNDLRVRRCHVLEAAGHTLDDIANDHGIMCAEPGASLLQQARRAPDRAQAIWLTFLWFTNDDRAVSHSLAASFRAWRALEDARPLGF